MRTLVTILCSLVLISCNVKLFGTNTGNPGFVGSSPISDVSLYLASKVCQKTASCFSQAVSGTCYSQVINLAGYTSELGVTASSYSTLSLLNLAVTAGQVTVNTTNETNCLLAIANLSCTDPIVTSSYSTGASSDYSLTKLLFHASTSCTQIF